MPPPSGRAACSVNPRGPLMPPRLRRPADPGRDPGPGQGSPWRRRTQGPALGSAASRRRQERRATRLGWGLSPWGSRGMGAANRQLGGLSRASLCRQGTGGAGGLGVGEGALARSGGPLAAPRPRGPPQRWGRRGAAPGGGVVRGRPRRGGHLRAPPPPPPPPPGPLCASPHPGRGVVVVRPRPPPGHPPDPSSGTSSCTLSPDLAAASCKMRSMLPRGACGPCRCTQGAHSLPTAQRPGPLGRGSRGDDAKLSALSRPEGWPRQRRRDLDHFRGLQRT